MGVTMSQMFPPAPTLTEKNLPSQKGKVVRLTLADAARRVQLRIQRATANNILCITGGYSGVGLALVEILYHAGGKVYIAGRSKDKAEEAINNVQHAAADCEGCGQLDFLELDLSDLSTIRPAVENYKAKETRLDVLWQNAGISSTPPECRSKQGIELQMATNALGPYLLAELLRPMLAATARNAPEGSVRVVWTSSISVEMQSPPGGLNLQDLESVPTDKYLNYANSKAGNVLLCMEMGQLSTSKKENVLHVAQNPGNLSTNLLRHYPRFVKPMLYPLLYHAKYGAYTELWCGLSEDLGMQDQGAYVLPWGRRHPSFRPDIVQARKNVEEGGTGIAAEFRKWCDEKVVEYR